MVQTTPQALPLLRVETMAVEPVAASVGVAAVVEPVVISERITMNYRKLGRTGLKVSSLCLGTMQWGWTANQETAFAIMDAFVNQSGNFLDTADYYSGWLPGHAGGESEEIIGSWIKERHNRSNIILATKVRHPMGPGPNDQGLSRKHLLEAIDASLRRLNADYIDLYLM